MRRGRAFMATVVIAASLSLALPGCSGVKGNRVIPSMGAQAQPETAVQTDPQMDDVDGLLQELDSSLRSTDTLRDVPELNR